MTTTQIVQDTDTESWEQHSPSRPPFTRDLGLIELMRPMADEFGAGRVLAAAQHLASTDPAEQARIEADVRLVLAGSPLLAELFPAQSTAATAA